MSTDELEAERAQMQGILEDFPTSLAQDRELLTSLQDAGKHLTLFHGFRVRHASSSLRNARFNSKQQYIVSMGCGWLQASRGKIPNSWWRFVQQGKQHSKHMLKALKHIYSGALKHHK